MSMPWSRVHGGALSPSASACTQIPRQWDAMRLDSGVAQSEYVRSVQVWSLHDHRAGAADMVLDVLSALWPPHPRGGKPYTQQRLAMLDVPPATRNTSSLLILGPPGAGRLPLQAPFMQIDLSLLCAALCSACFKSGCCNERRAAKM